MYGIIYLATNTRNGKVYVGQTKFSLAKRIREHLYNRGRSQAFAGAIRKHGAKAFKWSIIDCAISKQELDEKERTWIAFYRSNRKEHGYNLTNGGDGFESLTAEVRSKISATLKGHSISPEVREKIRNKLTGRPGLTKGYKHTDEARKKMSIAKTGKKLPPFTEEHLRRMSEGQKRKRQEIERGVKEAAEDKEAVG